MVLKDLGLKEHRVLRVVGLKEVIEIVIVKEGQNTERILIDIRRGYKAFSLEYSELKGKQFPWDYSKLLIFYSEVVIIIIILINPDYLKCIF